jgi:hypothetical protein
LRQLRTIFPKDKKMRIGQKETWIAYISSELVGCKINHGQQLPTYQEMLTKRIFESIISMTGSMSWEAISTC